ncbi:hypothetical protein EJ077_22255 [Mesorhizobium sp. M8A.F.Ca.ET.057.01.1.1]|uniref:hypothetical protein n=1 Tax=Mesorhizobium sp. M8A.F.Ca.ET.057.01.1.1 TaxID=2493679 RepID=UPI000F75FF9B|nr:hypothetical protein [Mesorhizobium sp. M8A.F.Ca.ET.057.01.1.1]AZO55836.1 hypothetical protein EJ077_22255 [Mesorhizobium sp. M8A.F.Ca.ET.057.01.1.1]
MASADLLEADPRVVDWVKEAYVALTALRFDGMAVKAIENLNRIKIEFDAVSPIFGEAFFPEMDARLRLSHQEKLLNNNLLNSVLARSPS